jgi:TPR repeat protein
MFKRIMVATLMSVILASAYGTAYADDDDDDGDENINVAHLTHLANHGNVRVQVKLGAVYQRGQGVKQDYKKALYWFHKAAQKHNSDAEFSLGTMYQHGQGVTQNDTLAAQWFAKSAADRPHSGS